MMIDNMAKASIGRTTRKNVWGGIAPSVRAEIGVL